MITLKKGWLMWIILIILEISGLAIKENFRMDYFMDMEYGHLVIILDFMVYFN